MPTVADHYDTLLAEFYSRMFGDYGAKVAEQRALLERLGLRPEGSSGALDLGCGSGFQSIALAELGFKVTAVDLSERLLGELAARRGQLAIEVVRGDLLDVIERPGERPGPLAELAVCMGDTLPHLGSKADVERLFAGCARRLTPGGRFALTFRDLTRELEGVDRFIPVHDSADVIMTCFLEYEPETVKVHDLVYTRAQDDGRWRLSASFYRKLRLSPEWVCERLEAAGFRVSHREVARGLVTVVARRETEVGRDTKAVEVHE
ncbi:SAM-dependent methyltransferase [Sorangium cellulosum]|uniref:SAM-dependent methyltransferase n=1 Tax=Sorangium cellulosum TaxID=56 RepID=A0A2L0F0N1_SORCE|nr:class I SAM-dependent methyltransferase [Sorangium cellulosum]AUX45101.1 SAM-dependent methyltransferase [Sorangium cellulosum]